MKSNISRATISAEWDGEIHEISLSARNWLLVKSGKSLRVRGGGYRYEAQFFWDYWTFDGGPNGALLVEYGKDGGVGFDGVLSDASVSEHP